MKTEWPANTEREQRAVKIIDAEIVPGNYVWPIWLLVSTVVGGLAAQGILHFLAGALRAIPRSIGQNEAGHLPRWFTGWIVGFIERLFFTTAVGLGGVGPCMSAMLIWISLKAQTHHNIMNPTGGMADPAGSDPLLKRKQAYLGILGNLISLGVAIVCGAQIYASGCRDLTLPKALDAFPSLLRRVRYFDAERKRYLVFLTNHLEIPALTVARIYRLRWQIELFFRWIKGHLRIKHYYGTSPNAVKRQIWIAVAVYLMVAIIHKQLALPGTLHRTFQLLSVHPFEKMSLHELLTEDNSDNFEHMNHNQRLLWDL